MRTRLVYLALVCFAICVIAHPPGVQAQTALPSADFSVKPKRAHTSSVQALAVSQNGRWLASGGWDVLYVWDIASNTIVHTFEFAFGGAVAISPNERLIAFSVDVPEQGGDQDKKRIVRVRDLSSGQIVQEFSDSPNLVGPIAFSPDGGLLLTGKIVWDVATWRDVQRFEQGAGADFMPDGTLAVAVGNHQVTVWDFGARRAIRTLRLTDIQPKLVGREFEHPQLLVAAPDGRWFATPNAGLYERGEGDVEVDQQALCQFAIWDARTGRLIRAIKLEHSETITAMAVSPDGNIIAAAAGETFRLWDVRTGRLLWNGAIQDQMQAAAAFSIDGKWIAGADGEKISIWEVRTGKLIRTLTGTPDVDGIALSPDGGLVAVASRRSKAVRIWDLRTARLAVTLPQQQVADKVAFSPDGASLLVGNRGDTVSLWNVRLRSLIRSFGGGGGFVNAVAFSPNGQRIAVAGNAEKSVRVWDARSGRLLRALTGPVHGLNAIAFTPDGKSLVGGAGGVEAVPADETRIWEVESGRMIQSIVPDGFVVSVAISPDGGTIAVTNHFNFIELWDTKSGTQTRKIASSRILEAITFSPDGARIVVGCQDGKIEIWDARAGDLLSTLEGHFGQVNAVQFTPNGSHMVSGGSDGIVNVWNAPSGSLLVSMTASDDGEWLAITPEGFFAASPKGGGLLQIVRGSQVLSIDQFFQTLYRPDLVRQKLAGDPDGAVKRAALRLDLTKVLNSGPVPDVALISPRHNATLTGDNVTFEAKVEDRGGGIGRLEWRINGVTFGVQENIPPSSEAGSGGAVLRRGFVLGEGTNVIELVAHNAQNMIASQPATVVVNVSPKANKPRPKLHILAVGINEYQDASLRLKFATSDAKAISAALSASSAGIYDSAHVTTLLDSNVTAQALGLALTDLAKLIQPQDVFLFYLAGHGVTEDGRYYFLPYDYRNEGVEALLKTGIDQNQLQQWLANIPALRSVLIYDTCESGSAAAQSSAFRGSERLAAAERLTRAMGRTVMSAATDNAPAIEGYQGHGLFTRAVLDALSRADANNNNLIEVSELGQYLTTNVPDMSRKVFGHTQVPEILITGSDFVLVRRMSMSVSRPN